MGRIIYNKLLNLMTEKGLSTYKIRKEKIISEGTLQNIRQGKSITMDSVAALCAALNCQPGDILEYIPDNPKPATLKELATRTQSISELSKQPQTLQEHANKRK